MAGDPTTTAAGRPGLTVSVHGPSVTVEDAIEAGQATTTAACRACAVGDCQTCLNVYDDTIPCDCNHAPTTTAAPRPDGSYIAGLREARAVVERQTNLADLVHFDRPSDFRKGVLTCLVALDDAIRRAESGD